MTHPALAALKAPRIPLQSFDPTLWIALTVGVVIFYLTLLVLGSKRMPKYEGERIEQRPPREESPRPVFPTPAPRKPSSQQSAVEVKLEKLEKVLQEISQRLDTEKSEGRKAQEVTPVQPKRGEDADRVETPSDPKLASEIVDTALRLRDEVRKMASKLTSS